MIDQYPHLCTYQSGGTSDTWDDVNGWTAGGTDGESVSVQCRAVFTRAWGEKKTRGGTITEHDCDLVFPPSVGIIPNGTLVKITGQTGEVIVEANLLHFQKGKLHCRAWI